MAFCRQTASDTDPSEQAALSSVMNPTPLLQDAINELVLSKLVKQEGRELWTHRVVQEAMNYHSSQDLQDYFDSAVAVVYEAFPEQEHTHYLPNQWGACETYIPHGDHLAIQFDNFNRAGGSKSKLKGFAPVSTFIPLYANWWKSSSSKFIDLLSNCAWYSYEIGVYSLCIRLVDTAKVVCEDKESLQYATLCSIAGSAYYELNQLFDCRENWEKSLHIRELKLPDVHLKVKYDYYKSP